MDRNQKIGLAVGAAAVIGGVILIATGKKGGAGPPPPPPPGLATVRVTVVDTSGKAVAGASVSLDGTTGMASSAGIVDFLNVEPGSYSLQVSAAGYQPKSQNITILEGTNTFRVELIKIAPVVVTITLALINYPAGSFEYDAYLTNGTYGENVRISQQVALSGPSQTTLLVKIYDEAGATIYLEQVEVSLEDGVFYLFDCVTKSLIKQTLPWSVLSVNIPGQVAFAGQFLPTATLRLQKDSTLYRISHWIEYAGRRVGFLGWSFLPVELMALTKAPSHYRPLDAPDDIYEVIGCNLGFDEPTYRSGPCELYYGNNPLPPGHYPVYSEMFWARVVYSPSEGDIHTVEPRFTQDLGQVATLEVVVRDNFVLQNLQVPSYPVNEGELVTANVDVANVGVAEGEAEVIYRAGDFSEGVQTISLAPGGQQTITYQFTVPSPYRYNTVRVTFEIERFGQKASAKIPVV